MTESLASAIVAQAARAAPAIICSGSTYSYAELVARAMNVAAALRGVTPDEPVPVLMARGVDAVAAMLGCWLAGAAYVPFDPAYPSDRLAFMAEDCGARRLVTDSAQLDTLGWFSGDVVIADALPPAPAAPAEFGALAYLIYTSGSTGRPKGVRVSHAALAAFAAGVSSRVGLSAQTVCLGVTSFSFDISLLEVFVPLALGGVVVLATRDETRDGAALSRLIEAHAVNVVQGTPATFRLLGDVGYSLHCKVLCGGEAWGGALQERLCAGSDDVWNMYGPTESTVWVSATRVRAGAPLTIGPPLPGVTLTMRDGELMIGGALLADGYHARPQLDRERFTRLPNFGRAYATGDEVTALSDGEYVFVGRRDAQVKLRGHRVELGEIERVLESHPLVAQAVVCLLGADTDAFLVAAVRTAGDAPSDWDSQLRFHLRALLPEYMLPRRIVAREAFPLLPNGKLDRRALRQELDA